MCNRPTRQVKMTLHRNKCVERLQAIPLNRMGLLIGRNGNRIQLLSSSTHT